MLTGQIATVRGPMAFRTCRGLIVIVPGKQSTNTGVNLFQMMDCTVAAKVNEGTTTSEFSGKSWDAKANINPDVQLETAIAYCAPVRRHISFSNCSTTLPSVT
jgi:hypothetical protein